MRKFITILSVLSALTALTTLFFSLRSISKQSVENYLQKKIKTEEAAVGNAAEKFINQKNRSTSEEIIDTAFFLVVRELPLKGQFYHHPVLDSKIQKIANLYAKAGDLKKSKWLLQKHDVIRSTYYSLYIYKQSTWESFSPGSAEYKFDRAAFQRRIENEKRVKNLIEENKLDEAMEMLKDVPALTNTIVFALPKTLDTHKRIETYRTMLKIISDNPEEYIFLLGRLVQEYLKLNDFVSIQKLYQERPGSFNASIFSDLIKNLAQEGRLDEAFKWLARIQNNADKIEPLLYIASGFIDRNTEQLTPDQKQILKTMIASYRQ